MMKMNKKLQQLLIGIVDGLDHANENNEIKKIFLLQKADQDKLLEAVSQILLKYEVLDNKMDIPSTQKKLLKKELSKMINDITQQSIVSEKEVVSELLKTNAVERYLMNTYFYNQAFEIDYNLKKLSDTQINKIIKEKIKGEVWSDRLWRNKKTLNKELRKEVYDLLDGKTDINAISRRISKRHDVSFSRSRTLARTEATRVQAEVNEEWSKDNGIEQHLFVATLDDRTSEECQEEDGKIYDIDDSSKPVPPLHPNCRSVLVSIPYKDWKPSVRLDNMTKKNINYQTYKEWKN